MLYTCVIIYLYTYVLWLEVDLNIDAANEPHVPRICCWINKLGELLYGFSSRWIIIKSFLFNYSLYMCLDELLSIDICNHVFYIVWMFFSQRDYHRYLPQIYIYSKRSRVIIVTGCWINCTLAWDLTSQYCWYTVHITFNIRNC